MKIAENIVNRNFSTTAPITKWTTDVSQFNFSRGEMLFVAYFRYEYEDEIVAFEA